MKKKTILSLFFTISLGICACENSKTGIDAQNYNEKLKQEGQILVETDMETETETNLSEPEGENCMNLSDEFKNLELLECLKGIEEHNPLITQEFGADPFAMVYDDTLYIYMTQDRFEKASETLIKENSYSKIQSIRVISTKDGVNWTDHGEVFAAGSKGAAKWAHNSWAPAACHKMIDGKEQFFLYFADAGGGIGVLQADSPIGPFKDPIGHGMITRETPNCADIVWLFDPAVLVDDDGRAYIYFGGGVPQDKIDHPQTARVAELSEDMISIKGEPVMIDAPYLFEDSGIHKYNNKYYYTYCSNWQVDEEGTKKYGFVNAEIVSMESDSPMGPFTIKEVILENPGKYCGLYGNNHHCVFSFKNQWYMTYHTRSLEKKMGVEKGYRCTYINAIDMGEDGTIGTIKQNDNGMEACGTVNPFETVNACTFSHQVGLSTKPADAISEFYGSGDMAVADMKRGSFCKVSNVLFDREATKITLSVRAKGDLGKNGIIKLCIDGIDGEVLGYLPVSNSLEEIGEKPGFTEICFELEQTVIGTHDLYFVFNGGSYELKEWRFE